MIIADKYRLTLKNYWVIHNQDLPLCPYCGQLMAVRDSRPRIAKTETGNKVNFHLRRRCGSN